ncbi:MAG TPA: biliverdin-producing heme oxygenase, partial [Phycisphaerales bacterium]|nr:biliverdin-producing heme oxygenase [Phycisphaerales bacterium]
MTDHVNRDPHPAGHGHPHGHPHGAPASVPGTISHDLRESTSDLHTAAERSELQRLLVSGRASRSQYAEHLSQMFLVHRALDAALRAASEASPAVRTVVRDEHFQEPYLREDLAFLGVNPESIEPVPATTAMTARIAGVAA